MTDLDLAARFDHLFRGRRDAYGKYGTEQYSPIKQKMEISQSAVTVRGAVTLDLWSAHLEGHAPLGIVPIDENWQCHWGCIDVDDYEINHVQMMEKINHLPFVTCRTKSGGAHLFLFCQEPVPAELLQAALRSMAASLSLGRSEIFPKQTSTLEERGDVGNWLNMPYYGGDASRVALRPTGLGMTEEEFLDHASSKKVDKSFLEEWSNIRPAAPPPQSSGDKPPPGSAGPGDETNPLYHAPPCLQHLCLNGFPEGTGNNGFLNLCVYLRRRWPDDWQDRALTYSVKYFDPPRPRQEVEDVLRRLRSRDYQYRCRDVPIVDVCRSDLCRTRRFGVGSGEDVPKISGMSVLDTDPPLWFVDVDGRRVEIRTEDLQVYNKFQRVCMEQLHVAFLAMKQADWLSILNEAMRGLVRVEAPLDIGDKGRFVELVVEFCVDRRMANRPDEIKNGLTWHDDETDEYCFQFRHLIAFLESERFFRFNKAEISQRMKELGARDGVVQYEQGSRRRVVNCWRVPRRSLPELDVNTSVGRIGDDRI